MQIDIWLDYMCPFCFIGEKRFLRALDLLEDEVPVEIKFHSFELNKDAERVEGIDYCERLAEKYGKSYEEAQKVVDNMVAMAKDVGLDYHFESITPCNSFVAHRLTHYAMTEGLELEMAETLFSAYLCESKDISDRETLVVAASSVGLDASLVSKVLDEGTFSHAVREDERVAARMGIHSVPFFLIDGKYGIAGAQPVEVFQKTFEGILEGSID